MLIYLNLHVDLDIAGELIMAQHNSTQCKPVQASSSQPGPGPP